MVCIGKEKKFKEQALKEFNESYPTAQFYFFERKLYTRRRGWFDGTLFPGYLFFGVEELNSDFFYKLKKLNGFCRILPDNQNPYSIQGIALEELKSLINNGEMLGISKIKFIPGQSIKVISGPLKGYEGNVVRVNKKQKRITVCSFLTPDGKTFDLNYEEVECVGKEDENQASPK